MIIKDFLSTTSALIRGSFRVLLANEPLRMAGATAFFSTFALPPMLIIIVRVLGLVIDRRALGRGIMEKLANTVGEEGSGQVLASVRGFRNLQQSGWVSLFIFIFFLFVATTLFIVIQSSLNQIWQLKKGQSKRIREILRPRLHSLAVILATGVLFMAVLVLDGAQALVGGYINQLAPDFATYVNSALNHILSVLIVTVWFFVLFMYLPDGRPPWTDAFAGALVTSVLFTVGKLVLRILLLESNIAQLYGTAGSLVLLLLFVFYSSLILYFGAAFTRVWCHHRGHTIRPLYNATQV